MKSPAFHMLVHIHKARARAVDAVTMGPQLTQKKSTALRQRSHTSTSHTTAPMSIPLSSRTRGPVSGIPTRPSFCPLRPGVPGPLGGGQILRVTNCRHTRNSIGDDEVGERRAPGAHGAVMRAPRVAGPSDTMLRYGCVLTVSICHSCCLRDSSNAPSRSQI